MPSLIRLFALPTLVSIVLISTIGYFFGVQAFLLVVVLSVLEVTLSFDNAVVNARVLERMNPLWQTRFLTWGILVAVFGTRFILPILIVSIALMLSPAHVLSLVLSHPDDYAHLLETVHGSIAAFGGVFLLMVSLKYFFDKAKSVHWISVIERSLARWGRIEAIEIAVALSILTILSYASQYNQASILVAGVVGIILFVGMQGVSSSISQKEHPEATGLSLFLYLNILDSAFSLDGVVGAFALTTNLVIIMIGLGIGAYFVRAITVYMVQNRTLTGLRYLEHGAHWAILGLALAMLTNLVIPVPEVVTGLVGLCFVLFAYYSSIKETRVDSPGGLHET